MNVHFPAPRRGWPARLVIIAVVVVVLALAAATFVLSYSGVHEIALQAGVSSRLARLYPGTFDAVLVIACVAAVVLRDARWWARTYAWLSIILVVAIVGAADAVHAMNVVLPHRPMEGVVAAAPWVLVLLGFSLLLTILQHTRAHHAAAAPASRRAARRAEKQAIAPPATDEQALTLSVPALPAPEMAAAAEYRFDEPAVLGPVAAAESYPAAEAPASAEGFPPREPGEGAPSWHAYWNPNEDTGPAPQGPPAPGAETFQLSYPGAQADPVDPPYPAPTWSAAVQTYPAAADPRDGSYPAAAAYPSEGSYPAAAADPRDGSYPALADPRDGGYPALADPRDGSYPAAAAYPGEGSYPAVEADSGDRYPSTAAQPGEPGHPSAGASQADDDAPPFATAPFAAVPRLNRVRSTPTPPQADED